jgi:hypothetical protein
MQWFATSRHNPNPRTRGEEPAGEVGGLVQHVLAVVQDKEELLVHEVLA